MRPALRLAWRLLPLWVLVLAGAMLDRTRQTDLLKSILNGTTWPVVPAGWKIRLGSNAPTVSANMTEITGTGYTAGGNAVSFNTAAAGLCTGPTAQTTWTNTSGSSWTIVGIEVWDTAGTPLRWLWGNWTGQPITVANGNTFQVAASAVSADATAW